MGELKIYAAPLPFSNKQIKATVPEGSTVKEIVNTIYSHKVQGIGVVVMVGGIVVPQHYWKRVRPKRGTIINVNVVPMGGGGKKSPIASLLSIAVMIAAPYVASTLTASFITATGITSLTAAQVVYGAAYLATSVIGKLLVSALSPPPKPSNSGQLSNPAESPTQFIEGAQNSLTPWGVIPVCLGTNRMFPLKGARPYTETQDSDQYVRELFTYGYGKVMITDQKMGETALAEYEGVDQEHRLEGDLHLGTGLYTNDVYQEDFSVLLTQAGGYVVRTTQAAIDEAIVDFTLPQGLTEFDGNGQRKTRTVAVEIEFAESGVSPQDWSNPSGIYKQYNAQSIVIENTQMVGTEVILSQNYNVGYRRDLVVIDEISGVASVVLGTATAATDAAALPPLLPSGKILLATALVKTASLASSPSTITNTITITDNRDPSLFGTTFEDAADFQVTTTGSDPNYSYNIATGGMVFSGLEVTQATAEAVRRSVTIKFPTNGQYDIRVRRLTADSSSDQILDEISLSAIKSVKYQAPVRKVGVSGTAMRIKGTDQLNGTISQYNCLVSSLIPNYNPDSGDWEVMATSNPAAIYRYVYQGSGFATPLEDSEIILADIEAWHEHCTAQGYTYNRVIDYEASVEDIIRDVCAAGAASPTIVDGKRTVVIDMPKDEIVQPISQRNTWSFNSEITYSKIPHAFRVQFRNAEAGYQIDERIVYADGYDENNATLFEILELQSCTNSDLAYKTARRHLASVILRPETFSWMMDVEHLTALRGQRVILNHDVPLIGIGAARIKEVYTDGGSPEMVTGIKVDDEIGVPTIGTYFVRIRLGDGTLLYKEIATSVGYFTEFDFITPFAVEVDADANPSYEDLCTFTEAGGELDLIITKIEPQADLNARITAINYAPEIFDAENSSIPTFISNITTPLEFIAPPRPVLQSLQSDENVMSRNSDGSYTSRLVVNLEATENRVSGVIVKIRRRGTDSYFPANTLERNRDRVVITGLEDGKNYDIQLRYTAFGSTQISPPLDILDYKFIGASSIPSDVTGFLINVVDNTALFKWDNNPEIDIDHYIMKFSGAYENASWDTSQLLEANITQNRVSLPFLGGTYLIKAVDILGNESAAPAVIITYDPGTIQNAIAEFIEDPDFDGVKDNIIMDGAGIVLEDLTQDGYYYFENDLDLGEVFISYVTGTLVANGHFSNNVFDMVDVFDETDMFGVGGNDLFVVDDIFAMEDVFGIGSGAWFVQLQYRTTLGDPGDSPAGWSEWQEFVAGNLEFRAIEFRLLLRSLAQSLTPKITILRVSIDMPDRIERGADVTVDATTGLTVVYDPPFLAAADNPAVAITLQNGAVDDKIEYLSKTSSGFQIKVYNATAAAYVTRTADWIASGYGRVRT